MKIERFEQRFFHAFLVAAVAVFVPIAFTDEASKYTGESSESKPEGKRVLVLVAVRHQKSSPLISVQEGQKNTGQASGGQLHFPGPTRLLLDAIKRTAESILTI